MTDSEVLDFICRMKRKARRAASGGVTRVRYTDEERQTAIKILESVEARGSDSAVKTTCEMLSINQSTLMNWLEKYTSPEGNWHLRDMALRLHAALTVPN